MTIRVSYIVRGLYLQGALNAERAMILDTWYDYSSQLYHQEDCTCRAIDWLPGTFSLYGLSMTSCQCRCLISWYKGSSAECSGAFSPLLAITSGRSETWRRQRVDALNIAVSSFLEYLDWNEFPFEPYMPRLHTFWLLRVLSYAHLAAPWPFVHWPADLTYLEAWRTLAEPWAAILSLSHYNALCPLPFADFLRSPFRWMHSLCSTLW